MLEITLDHRSPVPLYYQLQEQLRRLIEDGTLPAGRVLPAEEQLGASLGIGRATVRQAVAQLVREGRLERRRNKGTKVLAPPVSQSLEGFYSFAGSMAERGLEQHSRVLALRVQAPTADVAAVLQTDAPSAVFLERLRYAGGMPLIHEICWFPASAGSILFGVDLTRASIYDLFEKAGVGVVRAREFIRPVVLDGHQADLLAVQKGDPAFFVERTSYSAGGPVELRRSVIRGDRYLYAVELPRSVVTQADLLMSGGRP